MKFKKMILGFLGVITVGSVLATELEIVNNTGSIIDFQPVIMLAGKHALGKKFANVPVGKKFVYNSGIYKIIGFVLREVSLSPNGKVVTYVEKELRNQFPTISVTNRAGLLDLNTQSVCFFYPNKSIKEAMEVLFAQVINRYQAQLINGQWELVKEKKDWSKDVWK